MLATQWKERRRVRLRALPVVTMVATALLGASPAAAQEETSLVIKAGVMVLDNAFGWGLSSGLDALLGLENDPTTLSQESLEQIANIVNEEINAGFYRDYKSHMQTAFENANFLVCTGPASCAQKADDVVENHIRASKNEMKGMGLQATAPYSLLASLELKFMEEIYDMYMQLSSESDAGYTGDGSYYEAATKQEENLIDSAIEMSTHLQQMQEDFLEIDSRQEWYWRSADKELVQKGPAWVTEYRFRACYYDDILKQEICSHKVPCYRNSIRDSSCNDDYRNSADRLIREKFAEYRKALHDAILGDDFERLLYAIEFYARGNYIHDGYAQALCQEFDGHTVYLEAKSTYRINVNSDGVTRATDELGPEAYFHLYCFGDVLIIINDAHGLYLYAGDASNNYEVTGAANLRSRRNATGWLPEPAAGGKWAFRNYDTGLYLTRATPVTQSSDFDELQFMEVVLWE